MTLRSKYPREVIRILLVCMLLVSVQSCASRNGIGPNNGPDADVQQVAKTLDITAQALSVFQKTVINANQQTPKLISDQTADQLVTFSLEINKATKQAIDATRAIAKLSPQDRRDIGNILSPIVTAIDNTLKSSNLASIQSEQLRLVLQTSLTSVQTSIASVQLVLAVR